VKCIRCNTDNNLKARTANMGRCSSCNHPFAFEPTAMPENTKLTDPFFAKVIADLSANNTLFFTPRQFYYLLDKRLRSRLSKTDLITHPVGGIGCGVFAVAFLTIVIRGVSGIPLDRIVSILVGVVLTVGIGAIAASAVSPYINRRVRQKGITTLKVIAGLILLVGVPTGIITKSTIVIGLAIVLGT
jgi:hypothetical protein